MSDPIEQALAALSELARWCDAADSARIDTVRVALQSVAQEQKDWRAIETWMNAPTGDEAARELGLVRYTGLCWELELLPSPWPPVEARTRPEVISKAAEFCRKDMAK